VVTADPTPYLGIALAQAQDRLKGYFRQILDPGELVTVAAHYRECCPGSQVAREVLVEVVAELRRRAAPPRHAAPGGGPLERLRAINIVALAERYTRLVPAGPGKWRGCCPLHPEKTPSFYVFADSKRWRCFGACARGGDVVDLAMALYRKIKATHE